MDPITRYQLAKFEIGQRHEQARARRPGPTRLSSDAEQDLDLAARCSDSADGRVTLVYEPRLTPAPAVRPRRRQVITPSLDDEEDTPHPTIAYDLARIRVADFHAEGAADRRRVRCPSTTRADAGSPVGRPSSAPLDGNWK
mgnify:CR=1 FL=1